MREVIVLAYSYPPDNSPGALRPARFKKYLGRFGYEAHVVTAAPQRSPDEHIHYVPDSGFKVLKRFRRFSSEGPYCLWVKPAATVARNLRTDARTPIVFSTSPPAANHLAALWVKQTEDVKWVADFRDPLAGSALRSRPCDRLLDSALESVILSRADAAVANTDAVLEMWTARYPQFQRKFRVIWNGYDPDERIEPAPIPPRPYKLMAHVGHIYTKRHPGIVLETLSRLLDRGSIAAGSVKLVCLGTPLGELPDAPYFRTFADRGLVEFLPRASRDVALKTMMGADYLLMLDVDTKADALQVPSKLFDYARSERPVLTVTTRNSPVERILRLSDLPGSILYWDSSAKDQDDVIQDFLQRRPVASGPSAWFRESFDSIRQTETLAKLFDDLMWSAL